jgi:hypothetical protein
MPPVRHWMMLVTAFCGVLVSAGANPDWSITRVDTPLDVGRQSNLVVAPDGTPTISYFRMSDGGLRFAELDQSVSPPVWRSEFVLPMGFFDGANSLIYLPNGEPGIAYYDYTFGVLRFTFPIPGTWEVQLVDGLDVNGAFNSAVVLDDQPAIAYYNVSRRELKFAWRTGDTFWQNTVVDTGEVGQYASLVVLPNGQPGIAYLDGQLYRLRFAWHTGTDFTAGWQTTVVDTLSGTGLFADMTLLPNGEPAIAHVRGTYNYLRFAAHPEGASFQASWLRQTVDVGDVGDHCSISILEGQPAISYYDAANGDLKFARYDGTTWQTMTVDDEDDTGQYTSLAIVDGKPAISYYDVTAGDLKYAILVVDCNLNNIPDDLEPDADGDSTIDDCEMGACCEASGCSVRVRFECEAAGGVYLGDDTTCDGQPCELLPEACCLPDGSCIEIRPAYCMDHNEGAPQGFGTTCDMVACAPPEACCLPDGNCFDVSPARCIDAAGTPLGAGTTCDIDICPAACCLPSGICVDTFEGECLAGNGIFLGLGTRCAMGLCELRCPGDLNCDGRVSGEDIQLFIAALDDDGTRWRQQQSRTRAARACPFSNADLDGDGVCNFQDIEPFVQRLGADCGGTR